MSKFYTQTGDDGYTGLLGEGRTAKYDLRIEAVGAIDEANAAIGLARSMSKAPQSSAILLTTQKDLYYLMAEIAAIPEHATRFRKITDERVKWLENEIEVISKLVSIPEEFIVPGDSQSAAFMDLARTVIRRAERVIAQLLHLQMIDNPELLRYANRLSSLCYALEILENYVSGITQLTYAKE